MGLAVIANIIRHAILNDLDITIFGALMFISVIGFSLAKQIPFFFAVEKIRRYILQNTLSVFILITLSLFLPRLEWILLGITITVLIYIPLTFRYMIYLKVAKRHLLQSSL